MSNFKLDFERGICEMTRYVLAETREQAEEIGREIARELCSTGLDTRLVRVWGESEDEYYREG